MSEPLDLDEAALEAADLTLDALKRAARAVRARPEAVHSAWPKALAHLEGFLEATLAANPTRPVHCGSGCSTCCHQWLMDVEPHEIERLGRRVLASGRAEEVQEDLRDRAAAHRRLARGAADADDPDLEAALAYLAEGHPCVFLDAAGQCSVYEDRPWMCRVYFSRAPPERCTATALRAGVGRTFVLEPHPETDTLLAKIGAPFARPGDTGALVPDLLAWLERRAG